MNKSEKPVTVNVTLAKVHTHAGVKHAIGAKIDVSEADAAWLEENEIIVPAAPQVEAKTNLAKPK